MKKILISSLAVLSLGAAVFAPAQGYHRQQQKNQWKDLAIGAGALGVIGALTHNDSLTFGGLAGALYSAWRYDQDGHAYGRRYDSRQRSYDWVRVLERDRQSGSYRGDRDDDGWRYSGRRDNRRRNNDRGDNGNHYGWDQGRGNKHGGW